MNSLVINNIKWEICGIFSFRGDMCGLMVNTLNSGSGGLVFKPRLLRCFLRHGTLIHFDSLHPGV